MGFSLADLNPITGAVTTILNRVLPDKAAQEAAQAELGKIALNGELASIAGQLDINKTEAASDKPFEAGWRPFIGWVCGLALFFNYIVAPLAEFATRVHGTPLEFPRIDLGALWPLMTAMLGLAGARTYEKQAGVQDVH